MAAPWRNCKNSKKKLNTVNDLSVIADGCGKQAGFRSRVYDCHQNIHTSSDSLAPITSRLEGLHRLKQSNHFRVWITAGGSNGSILATSFGDRAGSLLFFCTCTKCPFSACAAYHRAHNRLSPWAHLRATLYNTVRSGFSLGSAAQVGQELPCMLSNSQAGHPFVSD